MKVISGVPVGLTTDGKIVIFDSIEELRALSTDEFRKIGIDHIFASVGDLVRKVNEFEESP